MRRIVMFNWVSIDGFFAGPNGEIDWIIRDPAVDHALRESGTNHAGAEPGGVDKIGFCEVPTAVALTPTHTGDGSWIQTRDGNVFAFGDAVDHGSPKRLGFASRPAVAVASF